MSATAPRPAVSSGPSAAEMVAVARAIGGVSQAGTSIWRELSDPDVDPQRLRRVLHGDPGVAARVMRVANSAFYGRGREITTLERAIVVLGLDAVRGIAAAACLDRAAERGGRGAQLLSHSTAVACFAQSIAAHCGALSPSEAFLSGLLHDFGLLVEWRLAGIRGGAPSDPRFHAHCADVVLSQWRLPEAVVDAVRAHHAPAHGGDLAACVRVAHAAVHAVGLPEPGSAAAAHELPDPRDLARVGLDADAWQGWLGEAGAEALEAAAALLA
jgi:HD-like signal output (HDOD) protein